MVLTILNARYVPAVEIALNVYYKAENQLKDKHKVLLEALYQQVSDPTLTRSYPFFPKYKIPKDVLERNQLVREFIIKAIKELLISNEQKTLEVETIKVFFIKQHENIKWAQNRWLIANPGLSMELMTIPDQLHPTFLEWLDKKFNVKVGDPVVHLHVISNNGRERLKQMGIAVPYDHWHESYFRGMASKALEIILSWPACKGLFCDSSWIFNPDNFELAPDGRPFVAFTHLKDKKLYGHFLDVSELVNREDFQTQKGFALRSERRKNYSDQGLFQVKVHGTFYPVAEMVQNQEEFDLS